MNAADWISLALQALALCLAIPASVLLAQVVSAKRPGPASGETGVRRPRIAILVPAHDESDLIAATVHGLRDHMGAGDRLLVVADNCSDETAPVARAAGAEVVERHDPTRRGKGFALDFGVRHLALDAPDVVVIVDADCEVSRGRLDTLAYIAAAHGRPVQSAYVMHAPDVPSVGQRIAVFAWTVKTLVRPLGLRALGLPCQLSGSGMALPWALIARLPLASDALAEDVELGVAAARAGRAPRFEPAVEVSSRFPTDRGGSRTQRRRWEQGSLSAMGRLAGPLLLDAVRLREPALAAMALDLAVPPLALLCLLSTAAALVGVGATYVAGATAPVMYLAVLAPGVVLAVAVVVAWWRFGRAHLGLHHLAFAPVYAAAKLGMYLSVALARRPEWVRTKRR